MKIETGRAIGANASVRRSAASDAAPGFAPALESPQRAAPAQAAAPAHSIDAILALQAEGFEAQRRARQARRGKDALDALEEVARALLGGGAVAALKTRLEALARAREPSGEPGLDAILLEIDTRLAVEIAKLEMAAGGV